MKKNYKKKSWSHDRKTKITVNFHVDRRFCLENNDRIILLIIMHVEAGVRSEIVSEL